MAAVHVPSTARRRHPFVLQSTGDTTERRAVRSGSTQSMMAGPLLGDDTRGYRAGMGVISNWELRWAQRLLDEAPLFRVELLRTRMQRDAAPSDGSLYMLARGALPTVSAARIWTTKLRAPRLRCCQCRLGPLADAARLTMAQSGDRGRSAHLPRTGASPPTDLS